MATFLGLHPKDQTAFAAAQALFAPTGPLTLDRNPALLIDMDGRLDRMNAAAEPLSSLLDGDATADFKAAIAAALSGIAGRLAAIELAGTDGKPQSFDLTLLPCHAESGTGVLILGHDISLERALREALIDSRQRFKELIDVAADFTWEVDADGKFAFVSGPLALGYAPSDLIGRAPQDFALADGAETIFNGNGPHSGAEIWMRDAASRPLCLLVLGQPLTRGTSFRGARGLARDITAQKAREAELAEARHRERLVVHLLRSLRRAIDPAEAIDMALNTAIQAVGADIGCVASLTSDGAPQTLGGDVSPADPALIQAASQAPEGVAIRQDGQRLGLAFFCRHDKQRVGLLILWRDIARGDWLADDLFLLGELAEQLAVLIEQLKGQEVLKHLSTTDALTGLLNRRGFETTLARIIERARHENHGGALVYIDLDNFKQINDHFGHAQGDAALVATADILRGQFRARDPIGRLGGDEFVAWLDGIDRDEAVTRAKALQDAAKALSRFAPGTQKPLGFSIGIAMLRADTVDSLDTLMARADEAMYRIKRGGKGSYVVVD